MMSNAERQKAYQNRKRAAAREKSRKIAEGAGSGDKLAELHKVILRAQELAAELNAELVAKLQSEPLTRQTALALEAIEGRQARITLPAFQLPA